MASMSSISKYSESLSKITECVYDITLNRTLMLGRWLEFRDGTGRGERQIWRNHIVRHIMCMSFYHFIDILQTRVSKTSEKCSAIRFTHVTHSVEFLARGKWISYRFWYETFQNCLMIMMSISLKIGKMWCLFGWQSSMDAHDTKYAETGNIFVTCGILWLEKYWPNWHFWFCGNFNHFTAGARRW